ncbi:MAG: hypothetical protein HY650_05255 [Acidobacteria bacterium]|nr:hypothetical protein [Acidobacteriota bacterium]
MNSLLVRSRLLWVFVATLVVPSFVLADHQAFVLSSVPVELADSNRVENSGAFVTFASGQTGTASLRVSLINHTDTACGSNISWNTLRLVTDDGSPLTSVSATLFRMPLTGANIGTTASVASVGSTDAGGVHTNFGTFNHTFDFCSNGYYIRINLFRTSVLTNVRAFAVQIQ